MIKDDYVSKRSNWNWPKFLPRYTYTWHLWRQLSRIIVKTRPQTLNGSRRMSLLLLLLGTAHLFFFRGFDQSPPIPPATHYYYLIIIFLKKRLTFVNSKSTHLHTMNNSTPHNGKKTCIFSKREKCICRCAVPSKPHFRMIFFLNVHYYLLFYECTVIATMDEYSL